jgi:hypothetical protein
VKKTIIRFLAGFGWFSARWYEITQRLSPKDKMSEIAVDYQNLDEVAADGKDLVYQYDPTVFDSIHHPRHTQWLLENPPESKTKDKPGLMEPRTGGDCDDSASWWIAVLNKNQEKLGIKRLALGCIFYTDKSGKDVGHAVCVFEDGQGVAHAGNWYGNRPQRYGGLSMAAGLKHFCLQNDYKIVSGFLLHVKSVDDGDFIKFGKVEKLK